MILVDTCVLLDVSGNDPRWRDWSVDQLAQWSLRGALVITPMVFAEWCGNFSSLAAVQAQVRAFGLTWQDTPQEALYLAAQAHWMYRRRGGTRAMVLPDFLIGAHAAVTGQPLLTRDKQRFERYFVGLEIVAP